LAVVPIRERHENRALTNVDLREEIA